MQVLRYGGPHPGSEAGGHDDGCDRDVAHVGGIDGWGARIRTWDRGTKTRCLTAWLRPTGAEYRRGPGRPARLELVALGEEQDEPAITATTIAPNASHLTIW